MKKFGKIVAFLTVLFMMCSTFVVSAAEETSEPRKMYPDDLFASSERFSEYFAGGQNATFREENGEQVFYVPNSEHTGLQYSLSSIPYASFTVHYEASMILYTEETTGRNHGEEACFLLGLQEGGQLPFHQIRLFNSDGLLLVDHWRHGKDGEGWYAYPSDDKLLMDSVDAQDIYFTVTIQVDASDVTVYVNGEYILTLTDSSGYVGEEFGYIAFRGTAEGYKVKNFNVYEGLIEPEDLGEIVPPVQTTSPAATQEIPTETPSPTLAPTNPADSTENDQDIANQKSGSAVGTMIAIIATVILVAAAVVFVLIRKCRK